MSPILTHLAAAAGAALVAAAVLGLRIGRLRRRLAAAEHDAAHDELTGLANRSAVLAHLDRATRRPAPVGVILFDLDNFKIINDTPGVGHAGGDQLLCTVARLLRAFAWPVTMAARLGGDEFVLVVDGDARITYAVAHKVRSLIIGAPLTVDGKRFQVGASVGVVSHRIGLTANQLLHYADLAMYEAKHARRGIAIYRGQPPDPEVVDRPVRRCRDRRYR
ncbi:GGDEF domain-containing protein [Micromonospora sp. CPCC 205371]|nr:GGDEF domain-containing protein [Micromonospora sp. CPCC 205371]